MTSSSASATKPRSSSSTSSATTRRSRTTSCSRTAGATCSCSEQTSPNWRITFVDTGARSTIGERLLAIAPYLGDDPYFLATYGDGLTDAPLPDMIDRLRTAGKTALFLSVRPVQSLHVVDVNADGLVRSIEDMQQASVWINGGFLRLPPRPTRLRQTRRGTRRRAVSAADRAGRAARLPLRRFLGADGYDQGQATPRRARRERPRALARSRGLSRARLRRSVVRVPISAARRRLRSPHPRCSARIPTTSRSAAAQRCCALTRTRPEFEVTWVVLGAEGVREAEARASGEAFLESAGARRSSCTDFATASSRTWAARSRTSSRS